MEISDIRKRMLETIDRSKRRAAAQRGRIDQAAREYDAFLDKTAVPIFRQIANILRAEGYLFTVFTPGGSVRLMSDRSGEDYIELVLETSDGEPQVIGRSSRSRGRRVLASERPIGTGGAVGDLSEEDVVSFVLKAIEPFVER